MKKISQNEKDTEALAGSFLEKMRAAKPRIAMVVGISGDLGAGKTAFVKAAARHLRVRQTVNSPTFVIMKRYRIRSFGQYETMFHIDAYRLAGGKDLLALGWAEILADPRNLVFVEWPERIKDVMPKKALRIAISHARGGKRELRLP